MKKIISFLLLSFTLLTLSFAQPAFAFDTQAGKAVFSANCAQCHMGGRNVVSSQKTLFKDALEKYDMYDIEKIKTQVMNGKAAMPAFGNRLKPEQIENVASYVLAQSEADWK